ncbi:MAG TPA: LysR family transcriptional regulator [Rhodopseudomonas sp.]|uniref:LysR family transcriptional regulator n=1 Tax=Rhodopseudomonas sp. TaxID=1078 RepID=UPI002ED90802
MRFDLRHVRAFVTLAEELHFGRAAERLHVAQPALSRTLRDLEREIGVSLLRRTTRLVELTDAGKAFLAECRLAQDHLDRAVETARRTAAGVIGELRVAYMDFAINGRLPELIRAFQRYHPEIRLELSFMPTSHQQTALLERRIDVGFMIGAFDHELVDSYAFDEDRYVALLPITHPRSNVQSLTLRDLAEEKFVLGNGENWTAFRNRLFGLCQARGFFPQIAQEASSSEGIFGLVAAGVGVSVYSSCVRNLQRRGIVIRPLDDVGSTLPVSAVWGRQEQSASLQHFKAFLHNVWGHRGAAS